MQCGWRERPPAWAIPTSRLAPSLPRCRATPRQPDDGSLADLRPLSRAIVACVPPAEARPAVRAGKKDKSLCLDTPSHACVQQNRVFWLTFKGPTAAVSLFNRVWEQRPSPLSLLNVVGGQHAAGAGGLDGARHPAYQSGRGSGEQRRGGEHGPACDGPRVHKTHRRRPPPR